MHLAKKGWTKNFRRSIHLGSILVGYGKREENYGWENVISSRENSSLRKGHSLLGERHWELRGRLRSRK